MKYFPMSQIACKFPEFSATKVLQTGDKTGACGGVIVLSPGAALKKTVETQ